jgi:hypothetical protein
VVILEDIPLTQFGPGEITGVLESGNDVLPDFVILHGDSTSKNEVDRPGEPLIDRSPDDALAESTPSGVEDSETATVRRLQEHRVAVGRPHREHDAGPSREETVHTRVTGGSTRNGAKLVTVDLFGLVEGDNVEEGVEGGSSWRLVKPGGSPSTEGRGLSE